MFSIFKHKTEREFSSLLLLMLFFREGREQQRDVTHDPSFSTNFLFHPFPPDMKMKKKLILKRLGFDDDESEEKKKRNLISMCLFGEKAMYTNGAVQNAKLRQLVYPDWDLRFYVDENV